MKFTIALAQIDSILGDQTKNIKKHVEFIRRAKQGGADLVVFPELSLSGYSIKDMNWDVALRTKDTKLLSPILKECSDISAILGCVEESDVYGIHNSAVLIEKGKATTIHRKIYPPTYGMFEELRYFSPGKTVNAFDLSTDSTNRRFVERSRKFTTLRTDKLVEESSTGQTATISSGTFYRPAVSGISDGEGTGGGGMTGQSVCRFFRHPKT